MKKPLIPSTKIILAIALLFALYFITASLGLYMYPEAYSGFAWPPAGIALSALLLFGYPLWPGIALGALAIAVTRTISPISIAFTVTGATLQALAGTWLLRDYFKIEYTFSRLRDVVAFVCAAIAIAIIPATLGATGHLLGHDITLQTFSKAFEERWIGNALSILILSPLILTWYTMWKTGTAATPISERILFVLFLVIVDALVFATPYGTEHRYIAYLSIFPLMWSTLRFGPRGKTLALFLTAFIAVLATTFDSGPFVQADVNMTLLSVQTFVAAVTIIFLLFAAVEEELIQARAELEEYVDKLEHALQETREGKPSDLPETELSQ